VNDSFDYVVIGAGHNGLCAGATLAESGRSVCVVDPLPIAGGLSASYPYIGDAPNHLLSLGAMDDMFMAQTTLAQDMRLADYGYAPIPMPHPYGWMNEDGDTLLLFNDFERTIRDIAYFSHKDADTYRRFRKTFDFVLDIQDALVPKHPGSVDKRGLLKLILKARPDRDTRGLLWRMFSMNVFDLINESFESDAMRGLWAYWCSMVGPADYEGTGVYLLAFHAVHRGRGVLRPTGGMTNLVQAFAGALQEHGGELRLGTRVDRIAVDRGRAVGVRLEDGSELRARRGVLSNPAPQVTLGELLEPGVLDRETATKVKLIPVNSVNAAAFKIDIAVGGPLTYPKAQRKRKDGADIRMTTFMTGTLEDHVEQMYAMKRGENPATPPVYMAILSASDRTLAPEGQDVLYLHSNVPALPTGGWSDENKAKYEQQITASATRYLGGLENEIGRVTSSPLDFERRFSSPKGGYFHVDMLPMRLGMNRPAKGLGGYRTPIANLYLAGAGSHPGGGVSGWPGRLAAQTALADEQNGFHHP
jgi:phytoene dehydrogenase-like protein